MNEIQEKLDVYDRLSRICLWFNCFFFVCQDNYKYEETK